jgi:hypothetical protein
MTVIQAYARGASPEQPGRADVTVPVAVLSSEAAPTDSIPKAPAAADSTAAAARFPLAAPATTELPSGDPLSAEATRRLACDAGLVEVLIESTATAATPQPLSVGRKTRTIPAAIKRALLLRDRTCRFPGCSHRLYLDGHHLHHWADGGETKLESLLLLCSTHHADVHEHGYRIIQDPRDPGTFTFPRPARQARRRGPAATPPHHQDPARPAALRRGQPLPLARRAPRSARRGRPHLPQIVVNRRCRQRRSLADLEVR